MFVSNERNSWLNEVHYFVQLTYLVPGGPAIVTTNTVCATMPAGHRWARNYHFECEGGPKRGRYLLFRQNLANAPVTIREIYIDHMQAIPDESLMKRKRAVYWKF